MRDKIIETSVQHDEVPKSWKWAGVVMVALALTVLAWFLGLLTWLTR